MKTALITVALALTATSAQADLKICNTAGGKRTVAIAYSEGGQWHTKGWWVIGPGDCKTTLKGDLKQQHYYYTLSKQDDFTGDGYSFCTSAKSFELTMADGDCGAGEKKPFAHIDTGATAISYTLNLTETGAEAGEVTEPVAANAAEGPATVAAFEPGSHGEPFAVQGVMQGCAESEIDGCMFYAEGVRWAVTRGAGGNDAAIDAMAALPVNAPVFVTGDILSMGDITVDALVSKLEPGTPDAYASMRDAMQGDWVSADDPQSMLSVVGSEETEIYAGETLITSVVSFADACPGGEPIGTVIYKQEMGGDPMDLPCFAVVDITAERMELSYVGRGNTLTYVRR